MFNIIHNISKYRNYKIITDVSQFPSGHSLNVQIELKFNECGTLLKR